jgi:hypothetical protein
LEGILLLRDSVKVGLNILFLFVINKQYIIMTWKRFFVEKKNVSYAAKIMQRSKCAKFKKG